MELTQIIAAIIERYCTIINSRIVARWNSQSGIHGESRASPIDIRILGSVVMGTMEYSGEKAWVAEYGSGSKMDRSSPYFQDYINGSNFNQWRLHSSRLPIMGRSKGDFVDLDGNTQHSSGAMAGLDLERDGDPRFQGFQSQHIIKEEIERSVPEIIIAIQAAVAAYTASQLTMTTEIYL